MKLTAKEFKRKQQTPWQPKQRPHFSQTSESSTSPAKSSFGQARGRGGRGRGRGRAVARNQAWVSGGVLKAGDFLGLRANTQSQFSTDGDYSQLAESARHFAASSGGGNGQGYETYDDYRGYIQSTSAPNPAQSSYSQQGQKRGGGNSSNTMFTAYGGYATNAGAMQSQTPGKPAGRGRGTGFGAARGGGGGGGAGAKFVGSKVAGKPAASAVGSTTTYKQRFGGSGDMGYGIATGVTATPLMQSTSQPVAAEHYATAVATDSYTSAAGQPQQQLYETYAGYDYADASAAYSQTAYYTTTGGHYLTPDTGTAQYYTQF